MSFHCELVILILALTLYAPVHTAEIDGGREAAPHSRPYMVLLIRQTKAHATRPCGGFLLNENFVMTAASCQAESYSVRVGVHDTSNWNRVQEIPVKESFPHEDYTANERKNDIMLLKLSMAAHICENVRPILLAEQGDDSLPQSCSVSGWGNILNDNERLKEANVTLTNSAQSLKKYCSKGQTGPEVGDNGGPLVCEGGKAYGVVSSRSKPDSSGSRTYCYTKISEYKKWICSIIRPNSNASEMMGNCGK